MLSIKVDGIKRETLTSVVGNGTLKVELVVHLLRGIKVGLGSFVPAEGPEGWELGLAKNALVVLDYLLGSARKEEVDFNLTTEGDVAESGLFGLRILSNNGKLSVSVTEVHTDILLSLC